MTIICAARDASGAYLACDLMSRGGHVINTVRTKLVITERWAMGFAGVSRFRQIAERNAQALDLCETAYDVAEAIRALIIDDGAQRHEGRGESPSFDTETVLVDRRTGDLFRLFGDCSLIEADRFTACGSGVETALGAIWAISSRYRHVGARELVEIGIGAASHLSAGCGRGMKIEKVWEPEATAPAAFDPKKPLGLAPNWAKEAVEVADLYEAELRRTREAGRRREARERAQDFVDVLCSDREGLTVLQAQQVEGGF